MRNVGWGGAGITCEGGGSETKIRNRKNERLTSDSVGGTHYERKKGEKGKLSRAQGVLGQGEKEKLNYRAACSADLLHLRGASGDKREKSYPWTTS